MDLRPLESFREVVRQGSFTAAARVLHLTQPAISQQVKALEDEAGARLLHRDGRGVRLTPAGVILLEAAETALGATAEALRRIRESQSPDRGRLVLACGDTVALYLLPPVLRDFRRDRPLAEVAVQNHGSRAILEQVLRREADLGIVTRPPALDAALWSRVLRVDPLRLALPPGHALADGPLDLAALNGQSAVLLPSTTETRALLDRTLASAGVALAVVMESGNLEVVKTYVAEGLGLSFVPEMALTPEDRRRLVVRALPQGFPSRKVAVVRRRDRQPGPLATALLALLALHFRGAAAGDVAAVARRAATSSAPRTPRGSRPADGNP